MSQSPRPYALGVSYVLRERTYVRKPNFGNSLIRGGRLMAACASPWVSRLGEAGEVYAAGCRTREVDSACEAEPAQACTR